MIYKVLVRAVLCIAYLMSACYYVYYIGLSLYIHTVYFGLHCCDSKPQVLCTVVTVISVVLTLCDTTFYKGFNRYIFWRFLVRMQGAVCAGLHHKEAANPTTANCCSCLNCCTPTVPMLCCVSISWWICTRHICTNCCNSYCICHILLTTSQSVYPIT